MAESRTNLKDQAKLLGFAGQALYKVAGETIAEGVWEEFEQLVRETAQYTGTTAASWNIGTKFGASFGGVWMRFLGPDETPLQVGHSVAVNLALNANKDNLNDMRNGNVQALKAGLNVWNEAPGVDRALSGPLRPVNAGAETAFVEFKMRVMEKVFIPLAQTYTPEDLARIAKGKR